MLFDMKKDYYSVLNVPSNASETEIKSAYRKLARMHHPDLKTGNAEIFKEATEAYEILGDSAKRKKYDDAQNRAPVANLTATATLIVEEYFSTITNNSTPGDNNDGK